MDRGGRPRKVYMIVTNDEYEQPVEMDIVGKQACCDYLGITPKILWLRLKSDKWFGRFKAVELGYENEFDDLTPNENAKILSDEERKAKIEHEKRIKSEKLSNERRIKSRTYYLEHIDERRESSRRYYAEHREQCCEYGKKRRRELKRLKKFEEWV